MPEESLPRLAGTIRLTGTALAMFQPVTGDGRAKTVIVGEGADLSGWRVTDITSEGVTLMRDNRIATLRLSYANLPMGPRILERFQPGCCMTSERARSCNRKRLFGCAPNQPEAGAVGQRCEGELSSNRHRHSGARR